jgi:SAM-dependent methyltransferase
MSDLSEFNAFERAGWATNDSGAYDRVLGQVTRRVIDDLLDAARVGVGSRVLDVATGPGYVAARAAARGADVLGLDQSPQMLALARTRHPGLRFAEADAEELALPDASFDAVVANFLVLHLGHPERAATGFARVLAPGGRCAITAWGLPDRARLFGVFGEAVRAAGASAPASIPPGPDFFRFGADEELVRLLAGAGLRDVDVRTIEFAHEIHDVDELWRGMAEGTVRTRALLMLQSEATRTAIRRELDRLLEPYRHAGGFAVPVAIKLASAHRA